MKVVIKLNYLFFVFLIIRIEAILFPIESLSRELKDISGNWKFTIDNSSSRNESFKNKWWNRPLEQSSSWTIDMPVPASYNDITQSQSIRDFVGWAWLFYLEINFKCLY